MRVAMLRTPDIASLILLKGSSPPQRGFMCKSLSGSSQKVCLSDDTACKFQCFLYDLTQGSAVIKHYKLPDAEDINLILVLQGPFLSFVHLVAKHRVVHCSLRDWPTVCLHGNNMML